MANDPILMEDQKNEYSRKREPIRKEEKWCRYSTTKSYKISRRKKNIMDVYEVIQKSYRIWRTENLFNLTIHQKRHSL